MEGWDASQVKQNVFGALDSSKWNFTEFDPYSIMLYPIKQFRTLRVKDEQSGELKEKRYKLTHNPINFKYNTNLSALDIAAIKKLYPGRENPSKRTKSGNGEIYERYNYSVVGDDVDLLDARRVGAVLDFFESKRENSYWRNWVKKFELPRGKILTIRNVTTRADQGYVKKWTRFDLNGIAVIGRIEDGKWNKGKVDGFLEILYIPE